MKNPFKRLRSEKASVQAPQDAPERPAQEEQKPIGDNLDSTPPLTDSFTEWCRTRTRGGVERRERTDIFEAYSVFGVEEGRLTCRYYHRYPEHERSFRLSYSRALGFDDFNRRLLTELDKGGVILSEYHVCIQKAASLTRPEAGCNDPFTEFTDEERAALPAFCDSLDTLKDQSYLHGEGVLCCECESVVGGERLTLRFRKLLPYDALSAEIPGVCKEAVGGYDITDMWVMSVFNRLNERCRSCKVTRLTSQWNIEKETVWLMTATGFPGVGGTVLIAVAPTADFRRFGFFSLDFSNK